MLAGKRVTLGPDQSHRYLYSKALPAGLTYRWATRAIAEPDARTFHTRGSVFVTGEITPEINAITSLFRLYEARLPRK